MKDDLIYIEHIIIAIDKIKKYQKEIDRKFFIKNTLFQDAIIRQLEIIGEASSKISPLFQKKYSEIPWREIIGMRNKLIHGYFGVDINIVWETASQYLPEFKKALKKILKENQIL